MFYYALKYVSAEFENAYYIFERDNGKYTAKKHVNFERPYLLINNDLRKTKKILDLVCTVNI
jgi:hypothetical protein